MSYQRFDPQDLVISAESITQAAWSGNAPTLTTFFSSSTQTSANTGKYYWDIYKNDPTSNTSASVQFAVTYGDKLGSGSVNFNPLVDGVGASRVIYGQYRTLILGDENAQFVFGAYTGSTFYAISVDRSRYKEKIFPGFNLTLTSGSTIHLTDNSKDVSSITFNDAGRVFQVVSGSGGSAFSGVNTNGYTTNSGSYGLFLPDIGTILLNSDAICTNGSGTPGAISMSISKSSNSEGLNPRSLYDSIKTGANFTMRSEETLTSDFVFVRARNADFNYTENPSFISGSSGEIIYPILVDNPQTFITTIGLYTDGGELVAVAKLSKPLQKDFTKELLVRVKLDF
tara:strand:+ start:3408 stop:4430 length:1023 start_codon:yes stop_codon:yes gene_type:complete